MQLAEKDGFHARSVGCRGARMGNDLVKEVGKAAARRRGSGGLPGRGEWEPGATCVPGQDGGRCPPPARKGRCAEPVELPENLLVGFSLGQRGPAVGSGVVKIRPQMT